MTEQKMSYPLRLFIVIASWLTFLVSEVLLAKILFPTWFQFVYIGFADSYEKAATASSEMMYLRLFVMVGISIIFTGFVSWLVFRHKDK
jgi:hypothetical protein